MPERWPVPPEAFPPGTALVGGAVRDALLNRLGPKPDLDFVLPGDAVALCKQLRRSHGGSAVVLDGERSIARLVIQDWSIDLARQEGDSLEADLHRRDYTVNAMALPLVDPHRLVDPLAGASHLATGQMVGVAEANLLADPLRLLRGLRLASELGFQIEPQTLGWIRTHHRRLGQVAGERVLAELEKLASTPRGHEGLQAAVAYGLLEPWCARPGAGAQAAPDPTASLERLNPSQVDALVLTTAEAEVALPLARLAAVVDGQALRGLRSSRRLQQQVERLRHWQAQLGWDAPAAVADSLPEATRLQLHRQLELDLPALLLSWATPAARAWLQRWRDPNDRLFHPRAAIDGDSLQRDLAMQASPQLGALLEHLMLEQAFGRLQGRSDALEAARRWLTSHGNDGRKAPCCD